jgi:hypothetical protein
MSGPVSQMSSEAYFDWCDGDSWEPLLTATVGTRSRHRGIAVLLRSSYAGVVCYHGCRPTDVRTYYRNGLVRADVNAMQSAARELFSPNRLPGITEGALSAAFEKVGRRDSGRIYVSLDRRNMIRVCSHYMRYGSEHLLCIGAVLSERTGIDHLAVLRSVGTPTLFRVRVDWPRLRVSDIDAIARLISANRSAMGRLEELPEVDFSAVLLEDLPAASVLGHEHPELGRDLIA